jgi:hypothetical protein
MGINTYITRSSMGATAGPRRARTAPPSLSVSRSVAQSRTDFEVLTKCQLKLKFALLD